MSKKTTLVTIVIAALLLAAVTAIALNAPAKKTDTTNSETSTDTSQSSTETTVATTGEPAAAITYTDDGFQPSRLIVKAGDIIRIENDSSMSLSFNSDDHPSHTDISELNVNDVPKGGHRDFVVTKTGTWGFHNHDNSAHEGEIVVK